MEPITLHAFNADGSHAAQMPYSSLSWSDTISDTGSMSATIPDTTAIDTLPTTMLTRMYGSIWAATSANRILHAGWLTHAKIGTDSVSLDIGGGWSIWEKRLVIKKALADHWKDVTVVIDEGNPPGDWTLTINGTLRDIARGLLEEAMKFGPLPYDLPSRQGGNSNTRTYNCWDLATVSDRLGDIADLENGPEIRFDPHKDDDSIRFALTVGTPEIIDHTWTLNTIVPGQRIQIGDIDCDGDAICTASYATGGKDNDTLLVARATGDKLTRDGYPPLLTANTAHSSVSVLSTLQSYAAADVESGDEPQLTVEIKSGIERDVHVGDHIDLTIGERETPDAKESLATTIIQRLNGSRTLQLKVTDISGSADSEWLTLQTRLRET